MRLALGVLAYIAVATVILAVVALSVQRLANALVAQVSPDVPASVTSAAKARVGIRPVPRIVTAKREAYMSFSAERFNREFERPGRRQVFGTSRRNEWLFRDFRDDSDDEDEPRRPMPTYRTVCVRMCDGYYFPISYATTRDRFAKDALTCQSTCGSEARLFVYRNPGGTADTMEDVHGRPYNKLPNAFLYRTQYVANCKCQANPWEAEAKERHRLYGLMDAARKGNIGAQVELKAIEKAKRDAEGKLATLNGARLPAGANANGNGTPEGIRAPAPVLDGERVMGLGNSPHPRPAPAPRGQSGGLPEWARRAFDRY